VQPRKQTAAFRPRARRIYSSLERAESRSRQAKILRKGGVIRHGKRFTWVLAMVVLAIVAGGVVYRRWQESGFDWRQFAAIFSQMNWFWILVTALLNLATYAGRTVRWAIMLRPLKLRPSYWNLFKATAIGFTAVILFGRPGELVRPYVGAAREGVSFSSLIAAGFLERIYAM